MRLRTLTMLAMLATLMVATLSAQARTGDQGTPQETSIADATKGVESITPGDIARHTGVIAHDSMGGRDTPSPGLEHTAQYVAKQFKAMGLQTAEDNGGWIWRYPLPGHSPVNGDRSPLVFSSKVKRGANAVVDESGEPVNDYKEYKDNSGGALVIATDTVLDSRAPGAQGGGQGAMIGFDIHGPSPVVVAGPHTLETLRQANLHEKVVVYVPAHDADSVRRQQLLQVLTAANHVIVVVDEDSVTFAYRREAARRSPLVVLDWYVAAAQRPRHWTVYVWAPAIQQNLALAGFDLADASAGTRPVIRELSAIALLQVQAAPPSAEHTAPNVLGVVPGTDATQVVVVTAHMDDTGSRPGQSGRIGNGADDNASGVAGLLALANAFARLKTPPQRSILFAAVSGGAKDEFWGSTMLLDAWRQLRFGRIVANLNLDRVDRTAGDSVRIAGLQEVELPVRADWLAAQHPELHLTVVDDGSVMVPVSDHYAFVRKAVPSLYLHTGVHGEAVANDAPAALDAEQEARIARLAFYLTNELANASRIPRWTAEGRRQRSQVFGR